MYIIIQASLMTTAAINTYGATCWPCFRDGNHVSPTTATCLISAHLLSPSDLSLPLYRLQKRASLSEISTGFLPTQQEEQARPQRQPHSDCQNAHKTQTYNHNVCCEPNTDCFWLHDSHFSLCETPYDPCLNDSSGSSFAVSSTHLVLRILFPSLPQDSPSSKEKT